MIPQQQFFVTSCTLGLPTTQVNGDFPYDCQPTTVAGLFDDSIAVPDIDKLLPDATKQASACDPTVMLPETPFIRACGAPAGRPSLSPTRLPAASSCAAVILAPSRASAAPSPITRPVKD